MAIPARAARPTPHLLLDARPGCSTADTRHEVGSPGVSVLADLARYPRTPLRGRVEAGPDRVPVEFYGDPDMRRTARSADHGRRTSSTTDETTAHRRSSGRAYQIDPSPGEGGRRDDELLPVYRVERGFE